jgi:stage IV sporulation protein FB
MTRRPVFSISAGAALLFSALFFLDGSGLFSALLPAVAVHEAGHYLALRLSVAHFTALRLDIFGLRMDYRGALTRLQELLCTLAGPLAGLTFTLAASLGGRFLDDSFLYCAAGVSLLLTIYNLLPVAPLDGGRILLLLTGNSALVRLTGFLTAGALLFLGLYCAARGLGAALALPGAFLLLTCALRDTPSPSA